MTPNADARIVLEPRDMSVTAPAPVDALDEWVARSADEAERLVGRGRPALLRFEEATPTGAEADEEYIYEVARSLLTRRDRVEHDRIVREAQKALVRLVAGLGGVLDVTAAVEPKRHALEPTGFRSVLLFLEARDLWWTGELRIRHRAGAIDFTWDDAWSDVLRELRRLDGLVT